MDITTEAVKQLASDINSSRDEQNPSNGLASPPTPSLDFPIKDEDLIKLTDQWTKEWDGSNTKKDWIKKAEEAEQYWLGKQHSKLEDIEGRPLQDNIIFESLETALPMMTRRNPEPSVELASSEEQTPQALSFAEQVKRRLIDIADIVKLRLKIKKAARHWAIQKLGVAKIGWDLVRDMPSVKIIRAKKLILDPNATVDEDGYTGNRIGELREMEAGILLKLGIQNGELIKEKVKGELGTKVIFTEWWTDEYTCWTMDGKVLLKKKNPHWNEDQTQSIPQVDEQGNTIGVQEQKLPGVNHFPAPKMPYVFLSIFNLGTQPMDDTSLIEQNLPQQDLINKRNRQIDQNADNMNNGLVISLERAGLTKEEATKASRALRSGGVISIPSGSPADAVQKFSSNPLPPDLFLQLQDQRARARDIFGVSGSTAAGVQNENTVRGKILNRNLDTDRIGGGITEYLEQFADDIYNWLVQMFYVYEFAGQPLPKLVVSVSEGSMLPKDSISQANQAMELWTQRAIDPITLFEKLEYPNPQETAKKLYLWLNAPQMLFQDDPEVQQVIQQQQMAALQQQQPPPGGKVEQTGDVLNQVPVDNSQMPL